MFVIYFLVGFILLYYGADFLVRGSSSIAVSFGVKKVVVGLTIVALGTSMPEFVVSFFAALDRIDGISVGNIVGSNLANILLVLGIATVIRPIDIKPRIFAVEIPVLLLITSLFVFFCHDGNLVAYEGIILFIIFIIYMSFIIANRHVQQITNVEIQHLDTNHRIKNVLLTILGLAGLVVGGQLTIKGAVGLAHVLGISEIVIGLTVVALGTSLPELFTSAVAVIKKEDEISLGNIIGSNLFNTAFVLGLVPIFYPLKIDARIISFDNYFMLGMTILLALFLIVGKRMSRLEGFLLLGLYAFYMLNLGFHFI